MTLYKVPVHHENFWSDEVLASPYPTYHELHALGPVAWMERHDRDDWRYQYAERFDISRKAGDHLGFRMGTHICAGMHLAKLEISINLRSPDPKSPPLLCK
jgi:cytochrome P450